MVVATVLFLVILFFISTAHSEVIFRNGIDLESSFILQVSKVGEADGYTSHNFAEFENINLNTLQINSQTNVSFIWVPNAVDDNSCFQNFPIQENVYNQDTTTYKVLANGTIQIGLKQYFDEALLPPFATSYGLCVDTRPTKGKRSRVRQILGKNDEDVFHSHKNSETLKFVQATVVPKLTIEQSCSSTAFSKFYQTVIITTRDNKKLSLNAYETRSNLASLEVLFNKKAILQKKKTNAKAGEMVISSCQSETGKPIFPNKGAWSATCERTGDWALSDVSLSCTLGCPIELELKDKIKLTESTCEPGRVLAPDESCKFECKPGFTNNGKVSSCVQGALTNLCQPEKKLSLVTLKLETRKFFTITSSVFLCVGFAVCILIFFPCFVYLKRQRGQKRYSYKRVVVKSNSC
eukprot:Awhi_evm1s9461